MSVAAGLLDSLVRGFRGSLSFMVWTCIDRDHMVFVRLIMIRREDEMLFWRNMILIQ